ncbi:cyclopropane-fatty-acyl-phospholipid synthase family protein [Microbulbifer sp. OS29]|uniref:Cyclopropane-fatty-acyl-phospholipid synthase family protein n=1 Tax=Microbulbifer okhotskensis TaxID=2926617 RepID=A0A9X2J7R1_9GAMM|nr:cyclopropane-fatty-acyl-phospholipid synthase family protein [Microbulbifer okhotskensis]MCO1336045.1 cyclopropane-fatty-acyl-phospholipid synthase family protein [Microbulbifer okhotskensis]
MRVIQGAGQASASKFKPVSQSWLVRLARKLVLDKLKGIERGHLLVEEGEHSYSFGQAQEQAEISAQICVHDPISYLQVLLNGTIGSGEAYMQGAWTSDSPVDVIRLMVDNMELVEGIDSRWSYLPRLGLRWLHQLKVNHRDGSRKNISAHYDLGNDFFQLFLDRTMLYSSAVYPSADAILYQASNYKMDLICRKLQLKATDHLLEIGAGWGAMAIHAAKYFGCKVTTTTISQKQFDYARQWVKYEGLEGQITLLLQDYRELRGKYDKIVSIEMVEAVGHEFHKTFFAGCSELLKEDGLMLMQAITIRDQRYQQYRKEVDFIQRYIFPGGCLPSIQVVANHIGTSTDMQIVGLEDITAHYARTINDWRAAFFDRIGKVRDLGFDECFVRMWDFYLCYCEAGFLQRVIGTVQFVFAKPRYLGGF